MQENQSNQMKWPWNGKPMDVNSLDNCQIRHILDNVLSKSKKTHFFGINKHVWVKKLNSVYAIKEGQNIDNIARHLARKRQKSIQDSLDYMINRNINHKYVS
jgi:hypothetical protein